MKSKDISSRMALVSALTECVDRINHFELYYMERSLTIERLLQALSEKIEEVKTQPQELIIKEEIQKLLISKHELDNIAEMFRFSLIPLKSIKYVNNTNQGSNIAV